MIRIKNSETEVKRMILSKLEFSESKKAKARQISVNKIPCFRAQFSMEITFVYL